MPKGIKPIKYAIFDREYVYLYKAVNPITGESYCLEFPQVNTKTMNKFLKKMGEEYKDKQIVLIMDNASFHKSKSLKIPENIAIKYLPPYSPQLNPVERVFQEIRKHMKNLVFDKMEKLKEKISEVLNTFTEKKLKSLCFYPYIKEAVSMDF